MVGLGAARRRPGAPIRSEATLRRAMKLLLDFLPIILFFGTFKYAEANKTWAAAFASQYLGGIVAGGIVGPE
jgi:hypothetical protein